MNNLQIFKNDEFGEIRTTTINNEPMFCLADVCKVLEIGNSRQAKTRLNEKGVISNDILTNGGTQKADFISESNLYKLIFQSRKPQAEKFSDWVTSEVLPTIRKHGAYMTDEKAYDITHNPESLADLLLQAGEQLKKKDCIIQEKEKIIKELEPKADFYNAVADSKTGLSVGEVAKILNLGFGRNKLFELLRNKKVLDNRNVPYQHYMDKGFFKVIENPYLIRKDHLTLRPKTLVLQAGVEFIYRLVKGEAENELNYDCKQITIGEEYIKQGVGVIVNKHGSKEGRELAAEKKNEKRRRDELIVKCREAGFTLNETAKMLKCSVSTVTKVLREYKSVDINTNL